MKRWKRGMAWLLSVLCILVTVQIPSIPAKATVSNGQIIDISADDAINWVKGQCGKQLGNTWEGQYQCVGLTAQYMKYLGTWFGGDASDYTNASNAPAGITVIQGAQPQKGDILVYTSTAGSAYYHAAIYEDENTTYHQNYDGKNYVSKEGNYLTSKSKTQTYWGVWRPNFKTNQRPFGAVDTAEAVGVNKIHVSGWAHDPDSSNETPMDIHVYLGTADNQVETYVGKVTTSFKRENDYQGYDATFNTPVSGNKYIYVWAIDTSGEDNNTMIGSKLVNIPSDTTKPTISNLKVIEKSRDGYKLQCNVSDNVGVSYVLFSTCTEASGKKDWVAYKVSDIVNGVATCEIKTSDFNNREGIYYTDIAAFDAAGNESSPINAQYNIDRTAPVVISAKITSYDKDGYNVTATATDNVGVTVIKFPSWNSGGTEDDIVWYEGTSVVNGTSTCRINIKDLKSSENNKYWTDIRAYDADGNVSALTTINHLSINIDSVLPVISDVTATKLSDSSYKVSCKVTDDNLQSVQFGTSVNGKTEVWKTVSVKDGVYEAVISADDFSSEKGSYVTTIKAVDTYGNESTKKSETVNLTDTQKPLTGIALNKETLNLEKGATETLTVSYNPADTTDSKEISWVSDNSSVAIVTGGTVTAVGKGTAKITATCGNYTATCDVTVTEKEEAPDQKPVEKPLTGITLNKETLNLEKGATETLTVTCNPADTTDSKEISWASEDSSIATVTGGTVTAVGKGTAKITATCGNYTATCNVTVTEKEETPDQKPVEKPLTGITLNKDNLTLEETATESLTVSYNPEDTTDNKDVIWSSDTESVATVSEGTVTAVSAGNAVITAKVGNLEATCNVTVTAKDSNPSQSEDPDKTPDKEIDPTPGDGSDVTPDQVPADKPKPVDKPVASVHSAPSSHTHNFKWVTVKKVSKTQDGIEELQCDCGMVEERSFIPSSQVYVKELYQNLSQAPENGEVSFDSGRIYTISDYLIKKLQERSDVITIITFEYNWKKYRMIIPTGVDYTKFLEDDEYFYGYFYFAKEIEAKVEEL